jgi:hypoxanthine phosphoribosyltransferase
MHKDVGHILYSQEDLAGIVCRLGAEVRRDYEGKNPILISVLKGAFIFMADLSREIGIDGEIEFLGVSSYGAGSSSSGQVQIIKDLSMNVEGRHLLVVEDILDSGRTLQYIMEILTMRRPASIKLCTLLDKPDRRAVPIKADYIGAEIPDEFVVGYGLDYAERYRCLPYIGVLKREVYNK